MGEPVSHENEYGVRLAQAVDTATEEYFRHMDGNKHACEGLYGLVMTEVERPLLRCVMRHCGGNRTLAAKVLGINRATLRKKLEQHGLNGG